jgi:methionyl-tRNA synthetase
MGLGLHLPDRLYSSEYLTFGQKQFSKSRGLVIKADDIVDQYGVDAVRYYLVANAPENSDADFTWEDFQVKVNSELIGKMGNFVNRTLSFALKHWPDGIGAQAGATDIDAALRAEAEATFAAVARDIQAGEFREALRAVVRLSETGNRFVDTQAPWKAVKEDRAAAEKILVNSLWLALGIAKLSRPFIPDFSEKVLAQLGQREQEDIDVPQVFAFHVTQVSPVVQRVELPKE